RAQRLGAAGRHVGPCRAAKLTQDVAEHGPLGACAGNRGNRMGRTYRRHGARQNQTGLARLLKGGAAGMNTMAATPAPVPGYGMTAGYVDMEVARSGPLAATAPCLSGLVAVVPARDEGDGLRAALTSLAGQTMPPDRIIVVVNNSTDTTEAVARD